MGEAVRNVLCCKALRMGLDRAVMVLAGQETIREVIAFPKTQSATGLMTGAPSPVDQAALDEVRIQLKLPPRLIL